MMVRPIAGGLEALAPAKLNLFLEVLGRRADGYHDIESLMVAVDLHDTLTFTEGDEDAITLRCDDPSLPTDASNLVVRAALALKAATGCRRGARIDLRKSIPAQAGLAGGSSDAAASLVALDRLWGLGLGSGRLAEIAATLGSDVAFFLHGTAAVCRGRGEVVTPWALNQRLDFVLVRPEVGVSTAEVYHHLTTAGQPRPIGPMLDALAGGDRGAIGRELFNRLQSVAEALQPALTPVRDALIGLGPLLDGSMMSGSGSAYFGLAPDREAAESAARRLAALGQGWVRVVTCGP
ncbi:4-(cytidine 5'-diphospho)-2-C-methyl-D-erythritol kinase [Tundrisphaera sp. TA3]|uniref:4-(cytidine 5'-diphospho)-2-C-methyl-D-erythritol kinase n=1 Tax=Tundrisphaera sp. TA3 TaxID=3435775 RepID=UPI003EBC8182